MSKILYKSNGGIYNNCIEHPFYFELAMSGFLIENINILALDDNDYSNPQLIEPEKKIKDSNGSYNRVDLFVDYGKVDAFVELKNVVVGIAQIKQLIKYLNIGISGHKKHIIGVIVGPSFSKDAIELISLSGKNSSGNFTSIRSKKLQTELQKRFPKGSSIPMIYGIKLDRFSLVNDVFCLTEVYYPDINKRNYTHYTLKTLQGQTFSNLNKSQLAVKIVESVLLKNENLTIDDLQNMFPDSIQQLGEKSSLHVIEDEYNITERNSRRYAPEALSCNSGNSSIRISNQWRQEYMDQLIQAAEKQGLTINKENE